MGKTIAIMQPTYLPWVGYFDLIQQTDLFVFLDNVQFAKRSWQQRNRIKTSRSLEWLTVPAAVSGRFNQRIDEVELSGVSFIDKHTEAIRHNYSHAAYFNRYFDLFCEQLRILAARRRLAELNCGLIGWLCTTLGITTQTIRASQLGIEGKRTDLLAAISQELDASVYVSPFGSAAYLLAESEEFTRRGIKVEFQHYEHPVYRQPAPPFVPQASVIDLLFNEGTEAPAIICSGRRPNYSLDEVRSLTEVANVQQKKNDDLSASRSVTPSTN